MNYLMDEQAYFFEVTPHIIQATTAAGNNSYGRPVQNLNTQRQYQCYIQTNDGIQWSAMGINHTKPSLAWILSIPIGQTLPVPITESDTLIVTVPVNYEVRRINNISTYPDEYGNIFAILVKFD